jgi:hypothetical protein
MLLERTHDVSVDRCVYERRVGMFYGSLRRVGARPHTHSNMHLHHYHNNVYVCIYCVVMKTRTFSKHVGCTSEFNFKTKLPSAQWYDIQG